MRFKKIAFWVFAGYLFCLSFARAEDTVSLKALIVEARQNNPQIQAAIRRVEDARLRVAALKALPADGDMPLIFKKALSLAGSLSAAAKADVLEWQMAAAECRDIEQAIVRDLAQTYFKLFMNYRERVILRERLDMVDKISEAMQSRYASAPVPEAETLQIKLESARLSVRIIKLEQEGAVESAHINVILGRKPEQALGTLDVSEDAGFDKELKFLCDLAAANRPELALSAVVFAAEKVKNGSSKKGIFPEALGRLALEKVVGAKIGAWDVAFSLMMPSWLLAKQEYGIKDAAVSSQTAAQVCSSIKEEAFADIKRLWEDINVAKITIKARKEKLMPIVENTRDIFLKGYADGQISLMDVLDNMRDVLDDKMRYYQSLADYNMDLVDLELVIGVDPLARPAE